MRIGVLSDSHGRAETTARAVGVLVQAGVDVLIHLGDVGSEAVIDELVGHDAHVVFGNCDFDHKALGRYAESVGVRNHHPAGTLQADGTVVCFTHGHLEREMRSLLESKPGYLLHGHTHETRDESDGSTRIVNPGALFRASRYTVAVVDTDRDNVEFRPVEKSQDGNGNHVKQHETGRASEQ